MISSKHIGAAGEHLTCSVLFTFGWSPAIIDAEGMDIVAVRKQETVRVQAKSTLKSIDGWSYQWQVSKGYPKRSLSKDDCDIVACVSLDLRKIAFFPICVISKQLTRRMAFSKMNSPSLEEESWQAALASMLKS